MRFLAVQEDGYGVGVAQERLPEDVDYSMMAATGDTELDDLPRVEEGSMISNLPLLFADGYPTSLDTITLKQLEYFIAFMVQCSLGHDTAEVISQPQWWPKEVTFSIPLIRPKKLNDSWMANLKKLVFRCYTYHRSEYLLRFCSDLAEYPRDKLYYVNNWDSTTSLYHKVTGKLLVTFRNENMNYDKVVESPRRSLLPQHGNSSSFASKSKQPQKQQESRSLVVIQPPSDEIYLCDNCDAEFVGLEKMKDHEKTCGEHMQSATASRPQTPCEISPEPKMLPQNQFLQYFNLFSDNQQPSKLPDKGADYTKTANLTVNRASRRVRGSVNLTRCPTIPFSSPAGIAMAKKSKMMTESTQQERLDRLERYLHAPALGRSVRPKWLDRLVEYNRWVVTYKPNRDKPVNEEHQHVYKYKFTPPRGKLVLDIKSQLLYISCKPIYVAIERLSESAIAELKRDPSKYSTPIRRIASRVRRRPRPKSLLKLRQGSQLSSATKRKLSDVNFLKDAELVINDRTTLTTTTTTTATTTTTPTPTSRKFECDNCEFDDLAEITIIEETPRRSTEVHRKTEKIEETLDKNKSVDRKSETSKDILIVDLCSSDEEDENPLASSDENIDPRRATSICDNGRATIVKNQSSNNKFRSKTCVHPADSTSDWLRDNVLTDDNDKCSGGATGNGKCLGNVVLDSCNNFHRFLKPAP